MGGAFHRLVALPQRIVQRFLEIDLKQPAFLFFREAVVGSEAAKVEQWRVKSCIIPIDQPQALPIVEEVTAQQIVMPEDHINWPNGLLQLVRLRHQ